MANRDNHTDLTGLLFRIQFHSVFTETLPVARNCAGTHNKATIRRGSCLGRAVFQLRMDDVQEPSLGMSVICPGGYAVESMNTGQNQQGWRAEDVGEESMKESTELVSTDESKPSGRPDATGIPEKSIRKDRAKWQDLKWQGLWEEGSRRGRVGADPAVESHICSTKESAVFPHCDAWSSVLPYSKSL